jgi:hypothetical protein
MSISAYLISKIAFLGHTSLPPSGEIFLLIENSTFEY